MVKWRGERTDAVDSACGFNTSATGPFYCPPAQQIYINLGFFKELARMGGGGDFAQAYVLGHEVWAHDANRTRRILEPGDSDGCDTFAQ
jgi:predicted metalloprotease